MLGRRDGGHQGQVWVWLLTPRGWRLGPAGVAELSRVCRGAALPQPDLTAWAARRAGGYALVKADEADLFMAQLRDLALEHLEKGRP